MHTPPASGHPLLAVAVDEPFWAHQERGCRPAMPDVRPRPHHHEEV